ncbi:M56 family metallopeptidase [Salegentibacter chungangensis]|uniref:M56 family metallopeptidase n=1 Tax=Salegentibacter chungangensis TaxID=1335724 RepID=A0ABW3NQ03_9FLAO
MLQYILHFILFQLGFLLIYELLLKKETFFSYNRWYLLVTPVLAMLLPLLKFESLGTMVPEDTRVMLPTVYLGQAMEPVAGTGEPTGFPFSLWLGVYTAGFFVSLLFFFRKYLGLKKLFSLGKNAEGKQVRIVRIPSSRIACTFYNTVFLGDQLGEEEARQILSHEMVHVRQKHSLDLVYFEVLKIIFWFNPLVYLYQSRIATVHEFIADADVVKTTEKKAYFQQLLNTSFSTRNISFINQFFNHSLIKKRILMLQKSRSKAISKFKYLILVPVMLIMLTYVACSEEKPVQEPENSSQSDQYENLINSIDSRADFSEEQKEYYKEMVNEEMNSLEDKILRGAEPAPPPAPVQQMDNGAFPFAAIDQVPLFPGCEQLKSNEAQKKCMSDKISGFVNSNFDVKGMKAYAKPGVNRVVVKFRIDEQGNITDLASRAAVPQLAEEAERVVNALPQMQPGEQNGQKVSVMYSLPIVFKNGE